jgi:hypothetical protein
MRKFSSRARQRKLLQPQHHPLPHAETCNILQRDADHEAMQRRPPHCGRAQAAHPWIRASRGQQGKERLLGAVLQHQARRLQAGSQVEADCTAGPVNSWTSNV